MIYIVNQWTGFYMIGTSVMKKFEVSVFFYRASHMLRMFKFMIYILIIALSSFTVSCSLITFHVAIQAAATPRSWITVNRNLKYITDPLGRGNSHVCRHICLFLYFHCWFMIVLAKEYPIVVCHCFLESQYRGRNQD